ncbi:MAG TPA: CpsD/CapB family tyrosine-protein kinase [Clostridiales bacterium]|nr:CpsD/CapB family tyrosine-protein kinase [Clostridiales bacterium]
MTKNIIQVVNRLSAQAEEAYKVLRTNIQFCELDRQIKTLTITSCLPGEGKSTTSMNLGVSFAETGKKVLVVDADLRKPILMKHFDNTDFKGLSNYISGRVSLDDIIYNTNVNGLHFITSGVKPPNPAELIGSAKFRDFLKIVREQFDLIIFDTPPLGSVIDGVIIASQTDGTLLVIECNVVSYQTAQQVTKQLKMAEARILGVVLNKIGSKYYKGYNNYYDFYENRNNTDRELMGRLREKRGVMRL